MTGSRSRHLTGALLVGVVLMGVLLGACGGPDGREGAGENLAGDAVGCVNEADGYELRYPASWHVNADGLMPACSVFHPEPVDLTEADEIPLDVAVLVRVEPLDLVVAAAAEHGEREVSREDLEVDGRTAVRLELEGTGEGLVPAGVRSTRYVVDLGGAVLTASTFAVGEPDYPAKQRVLEEMMRSLRVTNDPTPS